jgi:formyl-CoA transferase
MILKQVTCDGWSLDVPGIVPKLSATPGTVRVPAPHLGGDTDAVLRDLGLTADQVAALRAKGVIS